MKNNSMSNTLLFKDDLFAQEFINNKNNCLENEDVSKQIDYLLKKTKILENIYSLSLLNVYKELPKVTQKNINNWYSKKNIKKETDLVFPLIFKNNEHIKLSNENIKLLISFNSFLMEVHYESYHHYDGSFYYGLNNFNINFGFELSNNEVARLIDLSITNYTIRDHFITNYNLIIAKIDYLKYKKKNILYDFNFRYFNSINYILEFSRLLESYQEKLIYLNYEYEKIKNDNSNIALAVEIKKIENIIKLESESVPTILKKPIIQKKKEEKEMEKKFSKFHWNDTEENIVWLFYFIKQAGLISNKDFDNLGIILQDTFVNKENEPFKNKQINKKKVDVLNKSKLSEKYNLNIIKLCNGIKKLIPD